MLDGTNGQNAVQQLRPLGDGFRKPLPLLRPQHQRQQVHFPRAGIATRVFVDVVSYAILGDGVGYCLGPEVEAGY